MNERRRKSTICRGTWRCGRRGLQPVGDLVRSTRESFLAFRGSFRRFAPPIHHCTRKKKEPARWPSNAFLLRLHRRAVGERCRSSPSKNASSDCNHPDCPSTISKKSVRFSGKHEFTLGRRHQLESKRGILVLHQVTLCVINADCIEWGFCLE